MDADEFLDGFALWEEHRPQSGDDWVQVAERCLTIPPRPENPSPIFAGLMLAVEERDRYRQALEDVHDELQEGRLEDAIQRILNTLDGPSNQEHDQEPRG